MISQYFQLVEQQLKTITELKQVDWYTGQLNQTGDQTLYTTPAAFIEFEQLQMQQMGNKIQRADINFNVYLVTKSNYNGAKRVIGKHLDLLTAVYQNLTHYSGKLSALPAFAALQGTEDDQTVVNTLIRTNVQFIQELSNLVISIQTFQGSFIDTSAHTAYQKILANLQINTAHV